MSKKIDTTPETEVKDQPFDFDTFKCSTVEDIRTWNMHAHKAFRFAKQRNPKCDPPISCKSPSADFHKTLKVKFQRFDQPENVLKVRVRNHEIDWQGQLKPGGVYELPVPVVRFLNRLAVPIFKEVRVEDGGDTRSETRQVGEINRFSCQLMEIA